MRQLFIATLAASSPTPSLETPNSKPMLAQLLSGLVTYGMPESRAKGLYDTYANIYSDPTNLDVCLRWSSSQASCYSTLSSSCYTDQTTINTPDSTSCPADLTNTCYQSFVHQVASHPATQQYSIESTHILLLSCTDLMQSSILWTKTWREQAGLEPVVMSLFANVHCEHGQCSATTDINTEPRRGHDQDEGYTVISESYTP